MAESPGVLWNVLQPDGLDDGRQDRGGVDLRYYKILNHSLKTLHNPDF